MAGRLLCGAALFLFSSVLVAAQQSDLAAQSHQAKELMSAGKFEQAIPIYRHLVEAVPGNPGLLLNLAMAEQMAGHPQAAIPHFQQVLKLQPDSVPALASLADAYASMERFGDAAPLYRKLNALDPSNPESWYGLGKCYEALAASSFHKLSKAAPQSPYVAALLADTRLQRKQYRSAFFFYQQAQAKLPKLPGIHSGLAKVYENTGHADWAQSERAAEKTLTQGGCTAQTPECRFRNGDFLAATHLTTPATPEALFWATKAYNQLAIQAFEQLGNFPESVEIHAVKADILHGHGQDAEASKEWRAALALAPGDARIERELARSLVLAHRYDEAIPLLTELLAREPSAPDLNFMLGESLWRTEKPEKAAPYLTRALAVDPSLLPAHAALGMVDAMLNKPAEAIPHLEKALNLDDDGSLHYSLARAYQSAGNTTQAQKTMQQYQQIKQRNQEINDQLAKEAEITAPAH